MKRAVFVFGLLMLVVVLAKGQESDRDRQIAMIIMDTVRGAIGAGGISGVDSVVVLSINAVNERASLMYETNAKEQDIKLRQALCRYGWVRAEETRMKMDRGESEDERSKYEREWLKAVAELGEVASILDRNFDEMSSLKARKQTASADKQAGYLVRAYVYLKDQEYKQKRSENYFLVRPDMSVMNVSQP